MFGNNLKSSLGLLLVLLLLASGPAMACADWLGFRNDAKQTVIVRTVIQTPNGSRAGTVMILYPGETRWDLVKDNNSRQVIVQDAKPPRKTMGTKPVPAPVGGDALYSIQPRPVPPGADPNVDLVKLPGQRK
jgi:hypothetical protein